MGQHTGALVSAETLCLLRRRGPGDGAHPEPAGSGGGAAGRPARGDGCGKTMGGGERKVLDSHVQDLAGRDGLPNVLLAATVLAKLWEEVRDGVQG